MVVYRVYERHYETSAKYFSDKDRAHTVAMKMVREKAGEEEVTVEHHTEHGERMMFRVSAMSDFVAVETVVVN